MAVNKVVVNGTTKLDLTSDTVTADKLAQGFTAHDKTGALITGTMSGGGGTVETCTVTITALAGGTIYYYGSGNAMIQADYSAGTNSYSIRKNSILNLYGEFIYPIASGGVNKIRQTRDYTSRQYLIVLNVTNDGTFYDMD